MLWKSITLSQKYRSHLRVQGKLNGIHIHIRHFCSDYNMSCIEEFYSQWHNCSFYENDFSREPRTSLPQMSGSHLELCQGLKMLLNPV